MNNRPCFASSNQYNKLPVRALQGLIELMISADHSGEAATEHLVGCVESSMQAAFGRIAEGLQDQDISESEGLVVLARMTHGLLQEEEHTYSPVKRRSPLA